MKNHYLELRNLSTLAMICVSIILFPGCSNSQKGLKYKTVRNNPNRNSIVAKRENDRALSFLKDGRFDKAEQHLKKALGADMTFGIAHNNLGKVYYHQDKLYLAAWEFQYAIKLLPNQPEPRNNLGLVFEAVGKFDDAVTAYRDALDLQEDNPELIGNLVRARIRRGDDNDRVRSLLSDLIMKDSRPDWLSWARQRLVMMGNPQQNNVVPYPPIELSIPSN